MQNVGDTLGSIIPTVETYSVDESFLDLGEFHSWEVEPPARKLRERVHRWVGIPTCVGMASTKTLAKVANRFDAHSSLVRVAQTARMIGRNFLKTYASSVPINFWSSCSN